MPFVTIAERVGFEEGFKQGFEEGFKQGFEEGLLKGILKGIEACLEMKFGTEGLELMPELHEIHDHVLLGKILNAIETAASPQELCRVWTRKQRLKKAKPE